MTVSEILAQCLMLGVILAAGDDGKLRVSPAGVLSAELRAQLQANKETLRRHLTAPPADVLGNEPCNVCGSRECWLWLNGRLLCRTCVVLDLAPMTLVSPGTTTDRKAGRLEGGGR
jgi:hypothetical protein